MRRFAPIPLLLFLVSCGGSPTGPTPPPPNPTFTGTVTNTVTEASVQGFTATISNGRLTVSAPGYITRETSASASTVDLIPEAGFDLAFYRQFARGTLEGSMTSLQTLTAAPSIYLQRTGLSDALVERMRVAAQSTLPALTGNRLQLAGWETGSDVRAEAVNWIVVELENNPDGHCGRSKLGASAGHIWMNTAAKCARDGEIVGTSNLLAHELGHALGFFHVDAAGSLMTAVTTTSTPSAAERHHGAIAYSRPRGNQDVDRDPN